MATKFEYSCNSKTCCLPTDILVEIAAKVASQSLVDLYHLKLTSKEMMNIIEDDYVYKHAFLDKVPFLLDPETIPQRQASFLSRCRSSGNLESLYREGMELFWNELLYDKGLDTIRMAAQKGHKRSMYAFSMTVLVRPNIATKYQSSFEEEAVGYLRLLRNQKCLIKCREDFVEEFVSKLCQFMPPYVLPCPWKLLCYNDLCDGSWMLKIGGWGINSEDDDEKVQDMCENCRWDHELRYFYLTIYMDKSKPRYRPKVGTTFSAYPKG